MEKYIINNIPQQYLLRILLQLFVVPPYLTEDSLSKDGINFHSVMHEGLKHYGQTSDLEGFLCTCLHYAYISAGVENKKLWWWLPLKVRHESEWKIISWSKEERGDPVALHCEVFGRARDLIELELLNQGKQKETSKFLYDAGASRNKNKIYTYVYLLNKQYSYIISRTDKCQFLLF
ncbi:hypothetical protein BDF14DRAFT_1327241 [Spinellus fusiger]|nr:hypothetical protein BDF14DRAFT_1327241 [Spinellus fusiger]